MATKKTEVKVTGDLAYRVSSLEARLTALEKQVWKAKKTNRKKHEYTEEEKVGIQKRLLAGREAARKKQEAEVKATKKAR